MRVIHTCRGSASFGIICGAESDEVDDAGIAMARDPDRIAHEGDFSI